MQSPIHEGYEYQDYFTVSIILERNVYGILADWLQKKPFFEFDKSFYYLTELLYKIKRDVENIALIEKEFVLKSVSEGYSRKRIRMNLNCIIRSAGRTRNLVALVTVGELLAMLDDMNEFESTGEEYFQAICDIKGASKLNQLMQIDGKPTFDMNTGRIACYISSKAGITPWWELYLDTEAKQYKIEELKYYYRYYLDEQGVSIIPMNVSYELLGLRNCLLMRFIDGGKESFLAAYAYLANAAEEEDYSGFTESIVFCLENYEQYNLVTQIAIADLVRCYGYRLKDLNINRMVNAINALYEMHPQIHLYDKNNSCEPFLKNNEDEYILIGCSETRKRIDY